MLYTYCIAGYVTSYKMMCIKNNTEFNDVNSSKCEIKTLI